MTIAEKLEDLRQYLAGRFPSPDFSIEVHAPDVYLEYGFNITCPADLLGKSRRLRISDTALEDLDTGEITALLDRPNTEKRWLEYRDRPFRLHYDVVDGLRLPGAP